jgi:cell wall-associated NlpC family hydrolase
VTGQPDPGDVQPGDFAAVVMHGPGGPLIRAGEWLNGDGFGNYEHALVYAGDGWIVQAMPHGAQRVRRYPLVQPGDLWSTGVIGLKPGERTLIAAAANRYADWPHVEGRAPVGYSALDYVALAMRRLRIPAPGLRSFIGSTGHMICSQLVDQCYADAGVHLFSDGRWPGYVTPAALADVILRSGQQAARADAN